MKELLFIILIFNVNLFAIDKELTVEQQKLLKWTKVYCYEKYSDIVELSKDRHFICERYSYGNYPGGLKGTIEYRKRINPWTEDFFSLGMLIITIIFTPLIILFANGTVADIEKKNVENKEQWLNLLKKKRIKMFTIIGMSIIIFSGLYIHTVLKSLVTNTLKNGTIKEVKRVSPFFDLFLEKGTPLLLAVSNGRVEVVKYLVEEKNYNINLSVKINYIGIRTPFELALQNESYDIVNYLKQYLSVKEIQTIKDKVSKERLHKRREHGEIIVIYN